MIRCQYEELPASWVNELHQINKDGTELKINEAKVIIFTFNDRGQTYHGGVIVPADKSYHRVKMVTVRDAKTNEVLCGEVVSVFRIRRGQLKELSKAIPYLSTNRFELIDVKLSGSYLKTPQNELIKLSMSESGFLDYCLCKGYLMRCNSGALHYISEGQSGILVNKMPDEKLFKFIKGEKCLNLSECTYTREENV